jgi:hypothetical protein
MQTVLQTMAVQAASAAGSAAVSGVAGSAAAVTPTGLINPAVQVGLAIAVATAAAAAGMGTALGGTEAVPMLFDVVANCGIDIPQFKEGSFTAFFEGFSRGFTIEEENLIENLVVEAYNEVSGGCSERHKRTMQNSSLVEQIFKPGTAQPSVLETKYDAIVMCDGCPTREPLFSYDTDRRRLDSEQVFFEAFVRQVEIQIIALVSVQELPDGFLKIAIAYTQDENGQQIAVFNLPAIPPSLLPPSDPSPAQLSLLPPSDPNSPSNVRWKSYHFGETR